MRAERGRTINGVLASWAPTAVALAADDSSKGSGSVGLLISVLLIIAVLVLYLGMRRARARTAQRLERPIEPGTEVVTRSGIVGVLTERGENEVTVRIAPDVTVRMLPGAVISRADLEAEEARRMRRGLRVPPKNPATENLATEGSDPGT